MAWDHDPAQPLGLSKQFAEGAAYWYWSAEYDENNLADCCARVAYFVTGRAFTRNLANCTKIQNLSVLNYRAPLKIAHKVDECFKMVVLQVFI